MIKVTSVSLDEEVAKNLEDMATRLGVSKSLAITMLVMREVETPITKEDRRRLLGPIMDARAERRLEKEHKKANDSDKKQSNYKANEVSQDTNNDTTNIANRKISDIDISDVDVPAPTTPSRVIKKLSVMEDKDAIERSDDGMI